MAPNTPTLLGLMLFGSTGCNEPTHVTTITTVAPSEDSGPDGAPRDSRQMDDSAASWLPTEHVPGDTADWTQGEPDLCHIQMDCDSDIPDEPKVECRFTVQTGNGRNLYDGWAGVELRGRSSLNFPKPQYSVELRQASSYLSAPGETWRYLDGGTYPGDGWISMDYDDSHWATGSAPLGYGDHQSTFVSYGDDPDNKYVTTWFRKTLAVDDPTAWAQLTLGLLRDDGAIVYLNGSELLRDNMPDGAVEADTLAAGTVGGDDETTYFTFSLGASALVAGENILAVEIHQASTTSSDISFDLYLASEGQELNADFFGMGGESDWVLNGAYVDRSLFRNKLCFDLFQSFATDEMEPVERYAPESVFCDLTLNGSWQGIYILSERIKRDAERIDLHEDELDQGRSFIVKNDDGGTGFMDASGVYGQWLLVYPKLEEMSEQALTGVISWLQSWSDAVLSEDPGDPESGMFTWMDLDSAVDFVILQEFAKNNDAYFLSVHLWKDLDGLLHFVPWDLDLSFGYPYYDCGYEGWVASRASMIQSMADVDVFRSRLRERWEQLRAAQLSQDAVLERISIYREVLGDTVYQNFELWPMDEITFEWGGTSWLCPVESYDEEYERFREWVVGRLEWMDENIDDF